MSKERESILVIDSEPSWLEFCAETLQRNGYEVYSALTVSAAQELLLNQSNHQIGVVLIDSQSLDENEEQITILTNTDQKRSTVVLFAINLTPQRARQAYKLGVSDCVSKPYDETGVLALVEQTLADYRIATSQANSSSMKRSKTVLVVDDDDDWLSSLVRYLPRAIDHVVIVSDYQMAVNQVGKQPFDLVISDLRLKDSDETNFQGMDLMRRIRQEDKKRGIFTPIIVVSAYGAPYHIRESYKNFQINYFFDKRYLSPIKYKDSIRDALSVKSSSRTTATT